MLPLPIVATEGFIGIPYQRFNDPGGDCYWEVEHPNIHIIESFEVFRYLQDHLAMTQSHVSEKRLFHQSQRYQAFKLAPTKIQTHL